MRTKSCLDEAAIQAYADGELAAATHAEAARHLAACAACAAALDEARAELSFFASAFAPDADLSIPTERLRASIDEAVAALPAPRVEPSGGNGWSFGALFGWLASPFSFAPRPAGAFAGLVALVALAVVFGLFYFNRPGTEMADVNAPGDQQAAVAKEGGPEAQKGAAGGETKDESGKGSEQAQPDANNTTPAPKVRNSAPRQQQRQAPRPLRDVIDERGGQVAALGPGEVRTTDERTVPVVGTGEAGNKFVPGEETYVRAVASLEKMIEVGGDRALRPNVRADYERNLAVVDRAIKETRRAALRNPKDQDASAYLFSSYQTKIDMMRSVADQAQVATLGH
jgi:hypothetical protein